MKQIFVDKNMGQEHSHVLHTKARYESVFFSSILTCIILYDSGHNVLVISEVCEVNVPIKFLFG
jgi:hypothetical protein